MTANEPKLRLSHPNLWQGIMGFGLLGVFLGLTYFDNPYLPFGMPRWAYCGLLAFFAIGKIIGASTRFLELARFSMAAGIFLSTFFGVGFAIEYFQTHQKGLLQIAIYSFFIGLIQFAALLEPAFNPLTSKEGDDV